MLPIILRMLFVAFTPPPALRGHLLALHVAVLALLVAVLALQLAALDLHVFALVVVAPAEAAVATMYHGGVCNTRRVRLGRLPGLGPNK